MKKDKKEGLKNIIDKFIESKFKDGHLIPDNEEENDELLEAIKDEYDEEEVIEPIVILEDEVERDSESMTKEEFDKLLDEEKIELLKEIKNEIDKKVSKEAYDFSDEICGLHEFKCLYEIDEQVIEVEFKKDEEEKEVHNLELELEELENEDDEMEECLKKLKELAEDINIVDDMMKIPCRINGVERMLIHESNCNIKPIPLLNVALITNLNISVLEVELNEHMESVMDVNVLLLIDLGSCTFMHQKTDVRTLYDLGLMVAVDSLLSEVELSPIEFRGITSALTADELSQLLKFSNNVE